MTDNRKIMSQSAAEQMFNGAIHENASNVEISDNKNNNSTGAKFKSFKNWYSQRKEQATQQQQLDDQLVSVKLKADWVHMKVDVNNELPSLATRHYNELKSTLNESLRFHDVFGHERFGYTSSKYNEADDSRDIKSNDTLITSTMVSQIFIHHSRNYILTSLFLHRILLQLENLK